MKYPLESPTTPRGLRGSTWDGEPDEIQLGNSERISQELRQMLLASCRAATMDGFLLAAAVIPAKTGRDGYAYLDENRPSSVFTNLDDTSDPSALLLMAGERLKKWGQ